MKRRILYTYKFSLLCSHNSFSFSRFSLANFFSLAHCTKGWHVRSRAQLPLSGARSQCNRPPLEAWAKSLFLLLLLLFFVNNLKKKKAHTFPLIIFCTPFSLLTIRKIMITIIPNKYLVDKLGACNYCWKLAKRSELKGGETFKSGIIILSLKAHNII